MSDPRSAPYGFVRLASPATALAIAASRMPGEGT